MIKPTKTSLLFFILFLWLIMLLESMGIFGQVPDHPFPAHTRYAPHIKPSGYDQEALDSLAAAFYDRWKSVYLRNDCSDTAQYYVYFGEDAINVSEGQGYGMMITAFFAGHDPRAKDFFDGLYRFYRTHPSSINARLMDWQQVTCDDPPGEGDDAATDGDVDIAFALLLAHAQWGSDEEIDYLSAAKAIIRAIMQDEVNPLTCTVKLGDWSTEDNTSYYYASRTSDFILDHFRTFACYTGDSRWQRVTDTCLALTERMQRKYAPVTGLLPDFIVDFRTDPRPAPPQFLEGDHDGDYYYNACRVPWRLCTDYLISGDRRSRDAVLRILRWLRQHTGGDVDRISSGYRLDGQALHDWHDGSFIAPFAVGAMADTAAQPWMDALFAELLWEKEDPYGDYYSNTLILLSLLVISGNYWIPACSPSALRPPAAPPLFSVYPTCTTGPVRITVVENDPGHVLECRIVDMSGKIMRQYRIGGKVRSLDLSGLPGGTYLITLADGARTDTRRIVKR